MDSLVLICLAFIVSLFYNIHLHKRLATLEKEHKRIRHERNLYRKAANNIYEQLNKLDDFQESVEEFCKLCDRIEKLKK